MIGNYLLIFFRNLQKNKLTAFFNIGGLTLGISSFILICLYTYNEYSFDRHIPDAQRIYRVTMNWRSIFDDDGIDIGMSLTSVPEQITANFPEVESATGIVKLPRKAIVRVQTKVFQEENFYQTTPTFFEVFPQTSYHGNLERVTDFSSIVLTESLAKKYFGSEDPLQQTLIVNDESYLVGAVIKDIPSNSSLRYEALIFTLTDISTDWCFTFFKMQNGVTGTKEIQAKINELFDDEFGQYLEDSESTATYQVEKLTDIHFGTARLYDSPKGNQLTLFILMTLALLIMFISCVNYVNLGLAQATNRQVEAGVRKIFGARTKHLNTQYIFEFIILSFVCFIVAGILTIMLWPYFKSFGQIQMEFDTKSILIVVASIVISLFMLSIFSGGYIAAQLTSATPIDNLKQRVGFKGTRLFSNVLLVFQFTTSIALVFSALIVMNQMNLLSGSGNRMNINQIMVIDIPDDESSNPSLEQVRHTITQLPYVTNISFTGYHSLPTQVPDYEIFRVEVEGKKRIRTLAYARVDENFFNTLNIPFIAGRTFSKEEIESEYYWNSPIVNEAFVKAQDWKDDPLQHSISYGGTNKEGHQIIGVVNDFGFHGFHRKAQPMIFYPNKNYPEKLMIHFSAMDNNKLNEIKSIWANLTKLPIDFRFLDDYFLQVVEKEKNLQHLLFYFSVVSIAIASLGLFGLINISLIQRKKETAIRRICGAQLIHLLKITWKEYTLLLLISVLLAYPISYISLTYWLESFPNKTPISLQVYIQAIAFIAIIVLTVVAYHAIQISKSKSIKWIRYE